MIASATPVAAALLGWLVLRPTTFVQPRAAAFAVLDAPILIAALTTAAAVVWLAAPTNRLPDGRRPRATALALLATGSATFVWSACLAFDYDARWSRHVRADNLRRSIEVAARITPHSLLFGQWPDWHGTVPEFVDDVLVAYPSVDQYRGLPTPRRAPPGRRTTRLRGARSTHVAGAGAGGTPCRAGIAGARRHGVTDRGASTRPGVNTIGATPPRRGADQSFSTYAKISGATMLASELMKNLGVSTASLPQVIFSFGGAPE